MTPAPPSPIPRLVLGGALVLSFIASISALFRFTVSPENKDIVVFMVGQLSGFVATVVGFYYSTTENSRHKNDLLASKMAQPVEVVNSPAEPIPVEVPSPDFGKDR